MQKTLVILVFAGMAISGRWLSLLDDFVTTNFGTRVPRARALPRSKILVTPLGCYYLLNDFCCF